MHPPCLLVLLWAVLCAAQAAVSPPANSGLPLCSLECFTPPLCSAHVDENKHCSCHQDSLSLTSLLCLRDSCDVDDIFDWVWQITFIAMSILNQARCRSNCCLCFEQVIRTCYGRANDSKGTDVWQLSGSELAAGLTMFQIFNILHNATLAFAMVWILLFLPGNFRSLNAFVAVFVALVVVFLASLSILVTSLFQCSPFEAKWELFLVASRHTAKCIDPGYLLTIGAGINLAEEVIILLALPLAALDWRGMSRRATVVAVGMLSLSLGTILLTTAQLVSLVGVLDSFNFTRNYAVPLVYAGLEATFVVTIACLPAMFALIQHWLENRRPDASQGVSTSEEGSQSGTPSQLPYITSTPEPKRGHNNSIQLREVPSSTV
ncbi:hypothetical protein VTJ49DRAFT_5382 [Mycothermus thermophilus]|uniref:Rhodopsin domain-containing protein n=1 Tax=Humicola insolens TaxID=85995 RepID=A0ABR3V3C6_HUMIN